MTEAVPPAWILILGGVLIAISRGRTRQVLSLALPLAALASVWWTPASTLFGSNALSMLLDTAGGTPSAPDFGLVTEHARGALTRVFGTVFALMTFGGALYAWSLNRRVELAASFAYAGSALGVVYAPDWLTMFVYWELMAILSTIVIWCGGPRARASGLRYAGVHLLGGVVLMAGITWHLLAGGSPVFAHLSTAAHGSASLILIGMLINAAAPPFASWLPDAYPEASASGSVFLSAFTTKTAVFTLLIAFHGEPLLIGVGVVMAFYGIVYAILENDVRRILAYSIVNQVGFMVCGIGIGTPLSLNGSAGHAFAHIIYKALLLMSAGSVLHMTGKRKCTDVGGLYRTMPVTMWCGIIGALAISAFPLTSGFVTKSMISSSAQHEHYRLVWYCLTAASAGVFLHAGIKFPWFVFFQKDSGLRPDDPPTSMRLAMLLFATICIGLGVLYQPLYAMLPFSPDVAYHPFTYSHVLSQLQLLLFAGLAFFVMLPMLKRTLTITLDSDWCYRIAGPHLWRGVLLPICRLLAATKQSIVTQVRRLFGVDIHLPFLENWFIERWSVSNAVLMITLMLLAYLLFNLART